MFLCLRKDIGRCVFKVFPIIVSYPSGIWFTLFQYIYMCFHFFQFDMGDVLVDGESTGNFVKPILF